MRLYPRILLLLTTVFGLAGVASAVLALPVWSTSRRLVKAQAALAAGDPATALVLSRQGALSADRRFIEGASLLRLRRWDEASSAFALVVAMSEDPELVRRALHNLALAGLRSADEAEAGPAGVAALASVAAGREALRMDPRAEGSRWNLALAHRLLEGSRPEDSPRGGDRGAVAVGGAGSAAGASMGGGGAMTAEDAERILDALRSGELGSLRGALSRMFESTGNHTRMRGPPW